MDLGREACCRQLIELLRETGAQSVVHLAFILDPQRVDVLDVERMWQINVAGTARLMEAISVVNRTGGAVKQFIFPSSVAVYGPETAGPVREDAPLRAHTLPYAIHKRESDEVVRYRAASLGDCHIYLLRPHIFTGASMQNYMVGALRGTPMGKSKRAARMRAEGRRLPFMLPRGEKYLEKRLQFLHVDDMARLLVLLLNRPDTDPPVDDHERRGPGRSAHRSTLCGNGACHHQARPHPRRFSRRAAAPVGVWDFFYPAGGDALHAGFLHHGHGPLAAIPWRRVPTRHSIHG